MVNSSLKSIENDFVRFWIEEGILYCEYKKERELDLAAAKMVVRDREDLTDGIDYPCLTNASNIKKITKEARAFFALPHNSKGIKRVAFYGISYLTKLICNIFIMIDKPLVPCKFFVDRKAGLDWLKAFEGNNNLTQING